jgi:hypothetical protein
MADNPTSTRLTIGLDALRAGPGDKLLRAVQRAVASEYEVLGEMGRGAQGKIVYLARETSTRHLVALQLAPTEGAPTGDMWLDVLRKLDGSVPSGDDKCPRCGQQLRGWGRFCSQCGADLSGVAPGSGQGTSVDQLLAAVKEAAGHRYEVLGQMDRAEGGGVVYFAREKATAHIAALRLQRRAAAGGGPGRYDLGKTMVLKSVVESMVGSETPSVAAGPRAPEPAPVAPPATPTQRPPSATRSAPDLLRLGLVALVLIVLLTATVLLRRRSTPAPIQAPVATTGQPAEPPVDSVELTIGGTQPARAQITVDGQAIRGASIRLPAGTHTISARAPGYLPASQDLVLEPGRTMTWTPQFVRAPRQTAAKRPVPTPPPTATTATAGTGPAAHKPSSESTATPPPLAIHDAPAPTPTAPPDTQPAGPLASGGATCATLFSHLEWSRALAACQAEAGAGSTAAQRTLATMYDRGLGTETNLSAAAEWYGKAGQSGDQLAQYRLGVLLRGGRGVKKDEKGAVKWFTQAAEQGEPSAQLALAQAYDNGKGVKRSRTTAVGWYTKAADQGVAQAQYRLGELYANGEGGLAKSEPDAVKWFRLAAAQGHKQAQEQLAKRGSGR